MKRSTICLLKLVLPLALFFSVAVPAQDAELNPGTIEGIVSVGGTFMNSFSIQANSGQFSASQNFPGVNASSASYGITVQVDAGGSREYLVTASIRTDSSRNTLNLRDRVVTVVDGGGPAIVDFTDPVGTLQSTITVNGAAISSVSLTATQTASGMSDSASTSRSFAGSPSSVAFNMPVPLGSTLRCSGSVTLTNGARITLPNRTVSVSEGTPGACNYELDAATDDPGSISGRFELTGPEQVESYLYSLGGAAIRSETLGVAFGSENVRDYQITNLPPGIYSMNVTARMNNPFRILRLPNASFDPSATGIQVVSGADTEINANACQAELTGRLEFLGPLSLQDLLLGLTSTPIQAAGSSATTLNGFAGGRPDATGQFQLVTTAGPWRVSGFTGSFSRTAAHPRGYLSQSLSILLSNQPGAEVATLACDESAERNLSFDTGRLTVLFSVAGGGQLSQPRLSSVGFSCLKRDPDSGFVKYRYFLNSGSFNQLNVETGSVVIEAPEAECTGIRAQALVDGTLVTFGELDFSIRAGADDVIDIGGPTVTIEFPAPEQILDADSIVVTGRATDDVEVVSVTVNGVDADLAPANNPADPAEVTFEAEIKLDKGPNTILAIATDSAAKTGQTSLVVYNDAGPPEIEFQPADGSVLNQTSVNIVGKASDDAGVASISIRVNGIQVASIAGDGALERTFSVPAFLQEGSNSIAVTATDVSTRQTSVVHMVTVVDNRPPEIVEISGPDDPASVNDEIRMQARFTDPDEGDSHTAVWDWGDGSQSDGQVTQEAGGGKVSGSHTYDRPGVYTVRLTVIDQAGESDSDIYEFVVVYDPDAGFVTGGGWINSPPGAYLAVPELTGKANFGFVSRYRRGQSLPSGNTQFQFQAGSLNFRSTSYDWLVIAGARARFKGEGVINNDGSYGFMLTAIDGDQSGGGGIDRFRIKIWRLDDGSIVYDNQMGADEEDEPVTALGGGSIVIHIGGGR